MLGAADHIRLVSGIREDEVQGRVRGIDADPGELRPAQVSSWHQVKHDERPFPRASSRARAEQFYRYRPANRWIASVG